MARAAASSRLRLRSTPNSPVSAAECLSPSSVMTRARVSAAAQERARAPGVASTANRSKWPATRDQKTCVTVRAVSSAGGTDREAVRAGLAEHARLAAEGRLNVRVAEVFSLADAVKA